MSVPDEKPQGIRIRPATPEDAEALKAVVEAAYAPWKRRLSGLPDVAEGLETDIAQHEVRLAVRVPGGAVLGGIVLALSETAHVVNLAVAPEAAGRGIGRALLNAAEDIARAAGARELSLATHKDMAPTLRFYENAGWKLSGRDGIRCFLSKEIG